MKQNRYKAKGGKAQVTADSVYMARWNVGKSEGTRMRNIMRNDYGKKPQPENPVHRGLPGFPRRTMIRG